jgi:6-phosphogluconolactonase (cycloisomerase 2 family)
MSPSGRLFAVCDKGNDEILIFRIDRGARKLEQCGEAFKSVPGSSPRYSVFHPSRPFLFVNHETKAIVRSLGYDKSGDLKALANESALPAGIADHFDMKQSDLKIHPSGRYLYSLIRGIDAVSVFAIDQATGGLQRIDTVTLDGKGPRGCAISPDGRFLIVAMWVSHDVLVYAIGTDGRLSNTGTKVSQPNPGTVTLALGAP